MDTRLLILIGAATVLVLALVYLIETLAVARRAKKQLMSDGPVIPAVPRTGDAAHVFLQADPLPKAPPAPEELAPPGTVSVVERALAGDYAPSPERSPEPVSLDSVLASLELRAAEANARTVDAPQELLLPDHLLRPSVSPRPAPLRPEPAPVAPAPVAPAPMPVAPAPVVAPVQPPVSQTPVRPAAVVHPVPETVVAASQDQEARRRSASTPRTPRDYAMIAPVELVFDDTSPRVGIRSGTRTYLEFQRIASVLFSDLARARSSR